jgi:Malectin domain
VAAASSTDYTLQVTPSTPQTITPGSSIVYNLTLTPSNGFTGPVTLTSFGGPPGTSTFSAKQFSFTGGQAQTATFTVSTSASAKAKTYFPLITSFSSNRLHDFQPSLTLSASGGSPDFTISATPSSQSVVPGGSTTYTVTVTPQGGFTGAVALSAGGLPAGATASFNPASINSSGSSTLTIATTSSTPIASSTITITGSSGSLSHSASVTLRVNSPGGTSVQINSGGPAVSPFAADQDFTGGATINHANTIDLSGVTNPAPMAVYQTGRDGNFTYTIPGFTAGSSHTVRLHFAETFFATAGSRTFNVSINGTQVLANFDIFAAAGAKNKAVIKQFTVNADSNGTYVIVFTSVINNSLVSGIEVQ